MIKKEEECIINPYVQLLSYPRCGSNFLYFILFSITGVKIQKQHGATLNYWKKRKGEEIAPKDLPMIFILRNPKECIPRQTGDYFFSYKIKDALLNLKPRGNKVDLHRYDYMLLLDHYEKFKGNKIIVYYEDLINNTKEESKRILDYISKIETPLGRITYNEEDLNDFFDNYGKNRRKSLKRYGEITSVSITNGEDLTYHSKKINKEEKEKIRRFIIFQYRGIFKKYLNRYFDKKDPFYIKD
jgi:hypothetical protein